IARDMMPKIGLLYNSVSATASPSTDARLVELVGKFGACQVESRGGEIGSSRRHALALASQDNVAIHYCDFDRLLHWMQTAPAELASLLLQSGRADYTMIGRTPEAFATHPEYQRRTEELTNRVFSLWYGSEVDITAGSCAMTPATARLILDHSVAPTNATDAEWPAIVFRAGGKLEYVETDGLSFETADYFADEIAQAGSLDAWLAEQSRLPETWVQRTRLALESMEAIVAALSAETK
ncbi:MAG TPA: hypothetical protein VMP10_02630, partial [Chloroflexota bacterium]|nr:hypothetical protein [Chloroflexota bacterium]